MAKSSREYTRLTKVYEFNHSDYQPVKSKAYIRVMESEGYRNPNLERLEKAKRANETRKQYSGIVKDIFFKDAVLASMQSKSQSSIKHVDIGSLQMFKEEADRKRKAEFEQLKLRHELGEEYLRHVRKLNEKMPVAKRKEMDEKRFNQLPIPKHMKNRKYLDDIARQFTEPKESVFQKDLVKKLNPTASSDSKNAVVENMKNYDEQMNLKETRMRFGADQKHGKQELGDLYVNSIEHKLKILDSEISTDQTGGRLGKEARRVRVS